MTHLAVLAGVSPQTVADLDEDEFVALADAVSFVRRTDSWTNLHEAVATAVEALWAILTRLEAGVAVVNVRSARKPEELGRYPRPSWVLEQEAPKEVVVYHVRDAVRMLKGGTDARN